MVTFSPFFTTGRTGWKFEVDLIATLVVAALNDELFTGPTIFAVVFTAKVLVFVVSADLLGEGVGVGVGVAVTEGVGVGVGVAFACGGLITPLPALLLQSTSQFDE